MVKKGTWATVRSTILEPGQRAPGIPEETAKTPLLMWAKGYLEADAEVGQQATVRTRTGRLETGVLEEAEPFADVNYGGFVPEILRIGDQAREILFGGEK